MRRVALLLLLARVTLPAQMLVDERRVSRWLPALQEDTPKQTLRCSVSPISPQLNFSFRFQAGYIATIPLNQFQGPGHRWRMITRITPEAGGRPAYLISAFALPAVPATKLEAQVGGGYLLGEGVYQVRYLLADEAGRTCRRDWKVNVHLRRGDSKVRVALPPGTVSDLSLRGTGAKPAPVPDDARPVRLTVLLHAAPLFPRRTRLRPYDILLLLSSVSSVLERVPATGVRLVAFNLDQQRELFRKDGFRLGDLPALAEAMTRVELGLVDARVLGNRRGTVETIAALVNAELAASPPPDAVVFLGPTSRFTDKLPTEAVEKPAGRPQFYFFELAAASGWSGRGAPAVPEGEVADSLRIAVARLGGKSFTIRSPGDLAKAIDRLEQGGRGGG